MYPLQKEKGFLLQDDFCDDLTDDLDFVFLCNPNNPTGLTIPQELLLKILDNCRERNIYLVLDECFIEFLPEPEKVTDAGKTGRISESADSACVHKDLRNAWPASWLSALQRRGSAGSDQPQHAVVECFDSGADGQALPP